MASNGAHFPINGGTYPPFGVITDTNHGSYVIIATWIFVSISVLFVIVRVSLRAWRSSRFGLDNALIVSALVFAIGQSISASKSVQYGLGQHFNALSEYDRRSYYRAILASEILSVLVFVLSKLSLIVLIANISPSSTISRFVKFFTVFIILWGISNVLSSSLQCGASVPMMTRPDMCIDEKALLFTHGIINIVTDFLLIILPVIIIWKVHLQVQQKVIVLALFWTRILVPITLSIRLVSLKPYVSGDDPTWDYLYPALWNQIITHLSIITACIPSIKPFLDSLQSSLINSGIPRHYISANSIELRPWRSSRGNRKKSSHQTQSTFPGLGFSTTTQNEIEGGVTEEYASTKALATGSVIHQQLEVDVVIRDATEPVGNSPTRYVQ